MAEYFHTWDPRKQTAVNELLGRIETLNKNIARAADERAELSKQIEEVDAQAQHVMRLRDEYQAIVDAATADRADYRHYSDRRIP